MNAKESIIMLRAMADAWNKAANDPKHYNSEGSHYLAMAAQSIYQECNHIEQVYQDWGLPQLESVEVVL